MRVLLVGFGTMGDVQPLVALGNGLRAEGHRVLLCGRPDVPRWIDLRGLDFFPVGSVPQTRRRQRQVPWFVKLHYYANAQAEHQFDALRDAARGADLLVSAGSQLVAASVARALGIRHRSVVYCPQMMPSRWHPPMAVGWSGAPPFIHRAGRRLFMELYNRMVRRSVAGCHRKAGLASLQDEFSANFLTNPLIACDPELASVPEDCPLQFDQVGYIHSQNGGSELPASLWDFLSAGPPPVYIGFGSTIPAPPAQLTRLIVRAVAAARCRAVVSSGWAGLGGVEHGDNIYFTGPVSHYRLFPEVAAVIHHGGAGTTATAARAGKPQVILPPRLYDQAFWRAQIVERGIGVWAPKPRSLTVRKLARVLVEVLGDRETARRAAELGEILIGRNAIGKAVAALTGSG
jgi:vancomycin aglycone glucosyltransferase